jgi:hypothetical protein
MTQDQIILLLNLKDAKERGAASQSCDRYQTTARELEELGFATWHGIIWGSTFYRITDAGLKALEKTRDKTRGKN